MTAYFLVPSLELVGTAPRKLSSTPRGGERSYMVYIMPSLAHFSRLEVGLLCKEASLYIVHLFLQFEARKARVLQTSLRILVD